MCPDQLTVAAPLKKQQGFLLPLALFILVAMSFFAFALSRTTSQAGMAPVQELISVQAFYAAESGAQEGLSRLFYPDASSRTAVDNQCAAINSLNRSYDGVEGLNQCSAVIDCTCVDDQGNTPCSPAANISFYTITSTGRCGNTPTHAERTIRVDAHMEQQ